MRLAGCQRLSLGVESGSQRILDAIDKKITVDEIVKSTELAKSVGIKVRHYMMLGNRGETMQSFEETQAFLERARPHEYIFSCLSVYPGTRDYEEAKKQGWLDPERYFRERFQEYKVPFDAEPKVVERMNAWFAEHAGLQHLHRDGVAEYRAVLEKIGEHHAAHLDLASALHEAGSPLEAEEHAKRALELGYPCPGVAYNLLACIAKARGDLDGMMDAFSTGAKLDPQHWVLIQNVNRARAWFKERGPERGLPLELDPRCDFQLLERTLQPTLPGPLPEGWEEWENAPEPEPDALYLKTPDVEGSGLGLGRKLTVI
jgi:anaerobic magnesium-protoporphyrin IX monomethyl ester cyclase